MDYNFEKSFEYLIDKLEGGYTNDKDDNGGETKYGISKKSYPDLDIENLEKKDVKKIYFYDYWLKSKCDKMPDKIDSILFFNSVLFGNKKSQEILQKTICNFINIQIDGIIGKNTLKALNDIYPIYKNKIINFILIETCYEMVRVAKIENNVKFLLGWINRVKKYIKFI